jgi:peroxiredoxin
MSDSGRYVLGILIIGVAILVLVKLMPSKSNESQVDTPVEPQTVEDYLRVEPDFPKNYSLAAGLPAPEFTYATIDNELIDITSFQGRKYLVLNFFETGSPYCQRQLEELQEFYSNFGNLVEIIGITSQSADKKNSILQFRRTNGITFPIMHDPSGMIADVYSHDYEPFFAFIGKDGNVINGYTGTIYEFHLAAWALFNWEGPSEVESNDLKAEADIINGFEISGHAHPGDVDWYILGGQERTNCKFTLEFEEDRDVVSMEVYSNENLIGIFEDGRSGQSSTFRIPGTCFLRVIGQSYHEGPYHILLEPQ